MNLTKLHLLAQGFHRICHENPAEGGWFQSLSNGGNSHKKLLFCPEPAPANEQWNPHFHDNSAVKLAAATALRAPNNKNQWEVLDCRAVSPGWQGGRGSKAQHRGFAGTGGASKGRTRWIPVFKSRAAPWAGSPGSHWHLPIPPSTITGPSLQPILSHHRNQSTEPVCVAGQPCAHPSAHLAFLTALQGTQTKLCMKSGINPISTPLQWLSCGASSLSAQPGHTAVTLFLTFPYNPLGKPEYLYININYLYVIYFWSPQP